MAHRTEIGRITDQDIKSLQRKKTRKKVRGQGGRISDKDIASVTKKTRPRSVEDLRAISKRLEERGR